MRAVRAVVIVGMAVLGLCVLAAEAQAVVLFFPGVCPGYKLDLGGNRRIPDLIITNGVCKGEPQQWKTTTVTGMCEGQNFHAKQDGQGNVRIECVPKNAKPLPPLPPAPPIRPPVRPPINVLPPPLIPPPWAPQPPATM